MPKSHPSAANLTRKKTQQYERSSDNIIVVPPEKDSAAKRIKGDQNYLTKLFSATSDDR